MTPPADDAPAPPRTPRTAAWQLAVTAVLLAATAAVLDVRAIAAQLAGLRPQWLALGAAISLPQLALCAARWRYTAARLGAALGFRHALAEYYLSTFANQVLPFGVLGDAMRVARHGRSEGSGATLGRALQAVVLERTAGQLVIALWVLAALPAWLGAPWAVGIALSAAGLSTAVLVARRLGPRGAPAGAGRLAQLASSSAHALWSGRALWVQLALSSLVALTLVAHYVCAAQALGIELPVGVVARVTPLLLASMALPLSFGGWGVREAVNAALFAAVGMDAAAGAAVGVSYGVITLVGSAPALVLLAVRR